MQDVDKFLGWIELAPFSSELITSHCDGLLFFFNVSYNLLNIMNNGYNK